VNLSSVTRNENIKNIVLKDKERRAELKKAVYARRLNKSIGFTEHMKNVFALAKNRRASSTRIRNRCNVTGRSNAVFRYFGLCGNEIRRLAILGRLPGVRHATW
jgi:small subunit ribosomal protein S14